MSAAFDTRLNDAVQAAERVFAQRGYGLASMRDVAVAARLSVAGLYYYLPSKQRALFLVCERAFARLTQALDAALRLEGCHEQRLQVFVRGHLDVLNREPHAYHVLLHDMDALEGEERIRILAMRRTYFTRASDLVIAVQQERRSSVSTHLATAALFGMMNWTPMWHHDGTNDVHRIADEMSRLFLHGVAA